MYYKRIQKRWTMLFKTVPTAGTVYETDIEYLIIYEEASQIDIRLDAVVNSVYINIKCI